MSSWDNINARVFLSFVAFVACVLVCSSALGQGSGNEDAEKAQRFYEQGAQHFYEKEYAAAIVDFKKAYRFKRDPMLLFNISAAHSRLENYRDALAFAKKAGEGELPERIRPQNDARIAALGARIRAEDVAGASASIATDDTDETDETDDTDETDEQKLEQSDTSDGSDPQVKKSVPPPQTRMGALGWTGVSAAVVGLGLAGAGGYVNYSLAEDIDAYEQAGRRGDADEYDRLAEDIEKRQQVGRIALYSGIALGSVGLSLWLVDLVGSSSDSDVHVSLSAGPDSAMVHIQIPLAEFPE